jgi:acetylornithine deacetylase
VQTIQSSVESTMTPRSTRLRSTVIEENHPLVVAGKRLGRNIYGSPTLSDKALLPFPSLKMGPGESARSHTADEFILITEIREGIHLYIQLLNQLL